MCCFTDSLRASALLKLLCLSLVILCVFIFVSGCAQPRKVIATWRGKLVEENRLNVTVVECKRPNIKEINWDSNDGTLNVHLLENCHVTYTLEKKYQKMIAVHYLSQADIKKLNGLSVEQAIGFPLVAGLTFGIATPFLGLKLVENEDYNKKELDKAIKELKGGAKEAQAGIKIDIITKPVVIARVVAEEVGTVTESVPSQSEWIMSDASEVPLQLERKDRPGENYITVTDDTGRATFTLGQNPVQAMALKPAEFSIKAEWNDKWYELGEENLTQEMIHTIIAREMKKSMQLEGTPIEPPSASIRIEKPEGQIDVGKDFDVRVYIKNIGKGPFYQLVAVTKSPVKELEGIKFEFGKLESGESLAVSKKIQVPVKIPSGTIPLVLKWTELNGNQPTTQNLNLWVKGLPQPKFTAQAEVIDDNTGNSKGNGDGRIQKGERIDLLITVRNVGEALARDVIVKLENVIDEGIVLEKGSQIFGEIPVNQYKHTRLTIMPKSSLRIDTMTVTLQVTDKYFGIKWEQQLVFPLESELPPIIEF